MRPAIAWSSSPGVQLGVCGPMSEADWGSTCAVSGSLVALALFLGDPVDEDGGRMHEHLVVAGRDSNSTELRPAYCGVFLVAGAPRTPAARDRWTGFSRFPSAAHPFAHRSPPRWGRPRARRAQRPES